MTLDQNIEFVAQQLEVVDAALAQIRETLQRETAQQEAGRRAISDLRNEVRALKQALLRPDGAPSAAEIRRRFTLEQRKTELEKGELLVAELRDDLRTVAETAKANASAQAALPKEQLPVEDAATLQVLEKAFVGQLRDYEPVSIPIDDVHISNESYLPAAGGYDLGFDISASDGIRLIWAYLLGLLETARTHPAHHLGLVVFDEPRQQSAGDRSLAELLKRAATSALFGQQVIFATSEPAQRIKPMIAGLDCQYVPLSGRLLQPT